ncbi:integration host factor subunit alpha [Paraburkholderia sp. DHOC27]|uniref:integration host factor subunit alpha n=1 Tax=Paraburkholderia sp. DHOC27 TaxID=2303330 RepID=UPI00216B0B79|nr:integration host factor subunit alpha [Paraburkholderia sp. DHOC27]
MKVSQSQSFVKESSYAETAGESTLRATQRCMRETVTRSDIAAALCTRIGINRQEAQELTDAFFDILSNTLERGENISLSSFGAFRLREKGPRAGRNPRTGKPVPIEARRVVTFLSSRTLRARIGRAQ